MTTVQDIDKKIAKIVSDFNNKVYDGWTVPGLIEKFKKAYMCVTRSSHQLSAEYVKEFVSKRQDELSLIDITSIMNIFSMVHPAIMYGPDGFDQYVDDRIQLDKMMDEYNKIVKDFEKRTLATRERMLKMSGITKSAPYTGHLKAVIEDEQN